MIVQHACARAGLLGNPSDGYGGKTLSLTIGQLQATVRLRPQAELVICPGPDDQDRFGSLDEFCHRLERQGMYGGVRLLKATLWRFADYCRGRHALPDGNFLLEYETEIPRGVGLAGSSAIVTATLRALAGFYELEFPPPILASLALSVERDILGIPAGLQDRVIQAFGGVVFMDFSDDSLQGEPGLEYGQYEPLSATPPGCLFVAWADQASQPTEVFHNDLRARFDSGDRQVTAAMQEFARLAEAGRTAWREGDATTLNRLINANFDLRARICQLPESQVQMVERARQAGASAKFCGSGGAIVGLARDSSHLASVGQHLEQGGYRWLTPRIVSSA